ncbi:FAD-dependent thymidylate synthase [Synechococcus sp. Cruz CV12-2-Slac-r]|nr:FAD-dependent thymidylate synthase [Synechococcus sp. Cruz CV12-2-Slac-r]
MKRFRVELIAATPNPQQCVYAGMHQDYSEGFVWADRAEWPDETRAGEICVKRLLSGERGHYGPLEHAQIVLNVGWFPHSVMQQARTHRVGVSFDVQCLGANTEVTFVKTSGALHRIAIADLFDRWTYGEQAIRQRNLRGRKGEKPGSYRRDCRTRLKSMKLRVLNEATGFFETSHIKDVTHSGIQPVYRLTMEDGRTLDCTTNHRLLTPDGWKTMGDALSLSTRSDHSVISFRRTTRLLANGNVAVGTGVYRDKAWLQEQINHGANVAAMAQQAGCSITTIRAWARRLQLNLPSAQSRFKIGSQPWNHNPTAIYRQKKWLQKQLKAGLYVDSIAERANCSVEAIKKWVYHCGLNLNRRAPGFQPGMVPWNQGGGGYQLQLSEPARQLRRSNSKLFARRGPASNFWKGGVSSDRDLIAAWTRQIAPEVHRLFNYTCQNCGLRGCNQQLHAHHLVPIYANPSLGREINNLVTLCQPCHTSIHQNNQEAAFAEAFQPQQLQKDWPTKPVPYGRRLRAHPLTVVNVEYLGQQPTYDLEVEEPWHNFVANGLVVHNSMRYTGDRIIRAANDEVELEEVFYLRPIGDYNDRKGKKYVYTSAERSIDLELCRAAASRYRDLLAAGFAEEHARGILPFDYRQHFVVSFSLRAFLHFMDLRAKLDAQLEIRELCDLMWPHLVNWAPQFAEWYEKSRLHKARLAP